MENIKKEIGVKTFKNVELKIKPPLQTFRLFELSTDFTRLKNTIKNLNLRTIFKLR